jgi:hypothetical protein
MERSEYIQRETNKATCWYFRFETKQEQNRIYVKHSENIKVKNKVKICQ